jgi:putative transposase
MKKTRFQNQIIGILNEQEQGIKVSDLCREPGISDATFYNWKSEYGGSRLLANQQYFGFLIFRTLLFRQPI